MWIVDRVYDTECRKWPIYCRRRCPILPIYCSRRRCPISPIYQYYCKRWPIYYSKRRCALLPIYYPPKLAILLLLLPKTKMALLLLPKRKRYTCAFTDCRQSSLLLLS